jgi:Zn-dependent peptidase ImmA (M78 family)
MLRSNLKENIIKIAKEIRESYGVDDIEYLASCLGADVEYVDNLNNIRIKEVYYPNIKTIALASNLDYPYARHLIAHGLGHHILHRDNTLDYLKLHEYGLEGNKELASIYRLAREQEAELFAAHLLIDEDKLMQLLNEDWIRDAIDPIALLADEFNVSRELMNFMLNNIYSQKYESISIC